MKSLFKSAKDDVKDKIIHLHPIALMALCDAAMFCEQEGVPFLITDAVTSKAVDDLLGRVSSTHRTGRAWDISTKGWPQDSIDKFRITFFTKYRNHSASDEMGSPRPLVHHDSGTGMHFHFQINSKYSLPEI